MSLVYRRKIFEAFQAVSLKAPFVFVKLSAGQTAVSAGFSDIAQGFCQLQGAQAMTDDLLFKQWVIKFSFSRSFKLRFGYAYAPFKRPIYTIVNRSERRLVTY